jgi:hypothetical protein
MRTLLGFPNPVNEKAARVVAAVVAVATGVTLLSGWYWLLVPIAYGFVARVLTGPRLSPLGWFASQVVAPRLGEPVNVAGPPKRFAQGIGAACTIAAALFALAFGWGAAADVVLAMLVAFATLEAVFGLCVGCRIFGLLMELGVVPEQTCAACSDLGLARAQGSAVSSSS